MAVFLISAVVFAVVIAAMAIGVMAGRPPIKGSCGGIGALGIDQSCQICGGNPQRCEEETRGDKTQGSAELFYDADR
ncbi:MAG: (Na+)-NQR maturation NqrM [Parahaliea sp.]